MSQLIAIAGPPLSVPPSPARIARLPPLLRDLVLRHNGFYAFESALLVLPADQGELNIERWNRPDGWRAAYGSLVDGLTSFAMDVFGGQFAIDDGGRIVRFDPETAERASGWATLDDWANALLIDFAVLTGQPVAHDWQVAHGPLPPGYRLMPRVPFVLGGEFEVSNLVAVPAEALLFERGPLASSLHDLPDGTQVSIEGRPRSTE